MSPRWTKRRRAVGCALLATALLTGTAACMGDGSGGEAASGFDAIKDAAKDEGTITWYTSIPEQVSQKAADAFTEEYDIEVELIVLTSGLLTTRYASEMDSGSSPADVVTVADPVFFGDAVDKGWTVGFDAEDTPAVADWPADAVYDDSYALVNIQPIGVTFDTEKAEASQFEDWTFLTDPSLKGEVYLVDPAQVPNWLAHMDLLRQTYGDDFLGKIKGLDPKVVDSSVPGAQQVAAGSGTLVYPSLLSVSNPLSSEGATVETVFPTPTSGVEQFAAISAKAPQPNAARLFLDFLLTEDAQTILNKDTGSSPMGDLPGTVPLPEGYEAPDIPAALKDKDDILDALDLG